MHVLQSVSPATSWNVPGGQRSQIAVPAAEAYEPGISYAATSRVSYTAASRVSYAAAPGMSYAAASGSSYAARGYNHSRMLQEMQADQYTKPCDPTMAMYDPACRARKRSPLEVAYQG